MLVFNNFLILYHCFWFFLSPHKIELCTLLLGTQTADNVSHTGRLIFGRHRSHTEREGRRVPSRMAQQVVKIPDCYWQTEPLPRCSGQPINYDSMERREHKKSFRLVIKRQLELVCCPMSPSAATSNQTIWISIFDAWWGLFWVHSLEAVYGIFGISNRNNIWVITW